MQAPTIDLKAAHALFQKMAEDSLDKAKWNPNYIRTTEFTQDEFGYTDKDNPENNREPTFNWSCQLMSQRLSDESFFYVRLPEFKETIVEGRISLALAIEDFENAIESLKEYTEECGCHVGEPNCEKHPFLTV